MKKLILLLICIIGLNSFSDQIEQDEYLKGKILHLKNIIVNPVPDSDGVKKIENYEVEILEGTDKGKKVLIEFPIYEESAYNIDVREGQKVVLYKDNMSGLPELYYIVDIDKRGHEMGIALLFIGLTVIIAKMKGVRALLSLAIVIGLIYKLFLPAISNGYSPILISTICALIASVVTIFITTGYSKKGIVAILGSVIGVTCAGLISMFFSRQMSLTGYVTVEALNYATLLKGIKIKEIISAGVILGSMGAVMDVAMSISSALTELKRRDPSITKKELFDVGMRIGQDIIGTMVNTLILAYIGSGILSTLFIYLQKDQYPLIRILNFESIAEDIIRAVAGSIGILIAVPVTAYLSGLIKEKTVEK
nr:YibE/F family protein [uncultured Cetobacterium sp.]